MTTSEPLGHDFFPDSTIRACTIRRAARLGLSTKSVIAEYAPTSVADESAESTFQRLAPGIRRHPSIGVEKHTRCNSHRKKPRFTRVAKRSGHALLRSHITFCRRNRLSMKAILRKDTPWLYTKLTARRASSGSMLSTPKIMRLSPGSTVNRAWQHGNPSRLSASDPTSAVASSVQISPG